MNTKLQDLDLIDLISERHRSLQKLLEKLWNEFSPISISFSEWTVLSKVYKKQPTISEIAKHIDITRQATHKIVKQLETKNLVKVTNAIHNKKEKCLLLTPLGEECIEKSEELMKSIESKIAQAISEKELVHLKDLLKLDWGLDTE